MGLEIEPRPVEVLQGKGPKCWAASVTSWLTVNKNRQQLNMQQLIENYGNPEKGGAFLIAIPNFGS